MNFGQSLKRKIMLLRSRENSVGKWAQHSILSHVFPEFLFRSYCLTKASIDLMEIAKEAVFNKGETRSIYIDYLNEHIEEELDHAAWTLKDLASIGVEAEEVATRVCPPTVAALVGSQYYYIRQEHPVALLGYMAVLEGCIPDVDSIEKLIRNADVPAQAFSTLLEHARLDVGHADELYEFIDKISLSEYQQSLITSSAMQTIALLDKSDSEITNSCKLCHRNGDIKKAR